jgi:hypothetical protein
VASWIVRDLQRGSLFSRLGLVYRFQENATSALVKSEQEELPLD